jgi:lactoylglutathione lyase
MALVKDGRNHVLSCVTKISYSQEFGESDNGRRLQPYLQCLMGISRLAAVVIFRISDYPSMFSRIGAVILLVSDMKRSIRFYRDVLNMHMKEKSKDWVEFSERGTVLALHPAKKKRFPKSNSMLVGFSVSDFDDVCNGLKKKKVKFYKKPRDEPFGKHAIIQDPDGHLISIMQMPQEGPSQVGYYHGFAPA